MKAKIVGHMKVKKTRRHYEKPLKVSLGNAMRKAWALKGSLSK